MVSQDELCSLWVQRGIGICRIFSGGMGKRWTNCSPSLAIAALYYWQMQCGNARLMLQKNNVGSAGIRSQATAAWGKSGLCHIGKAYALGCTAFILHMLKSRGMRLYHNFVKKFCAFDEFCSKDIDVITTTVRKTDAWYRTGIWSTGLFVIFSDSNTYSHTNFIRLVQRILVAPLLYIRSSKMRSKNS